MIEAASFEKIQSQIGIMGAKLLDCGSIEDLKHYITRSTKYFFSYGSSILGQEG